MKCFRVTWPAARVMAFAADSDLFFSASTPAPIPVAQVIPRSTTKVGYRNGKVKVAILLLKS